MTSKNFFIERKKFSSEIIIYCIINDVDDSMQKTGFFFRIAACMVELIIFPYTKHTFLETASSSLNRLVLQISTTLIPDR